jgi:hypothetical protein
MLGQNSKIKVAVLEERVRIHEEMVERVDAAIQTLSETNQNICKMLAVHDERLNQCTRDDISIIEKIGKMEVKLEDISRIKWMTVGCGAVLMVLVTAFSTLASGWWTPSELQVQTEGHTHQQTVSPDTK